MSKRSNETDAEYKARKKAKKEKKKKLKKESKKKSKSKEKSTDDESFNNKETEISSSIKDDEVVIPSSTTSVWKSFTDAPFTKSVQDALVEAGYSEPSSIQSHAWPVAISGKDLIGMYYCV